MKNNKRLLLFILFFYSLFIHSQSSEELNNYVQSKTGIQNSLLFNGITYTNNYRVLSTKNQFLNESLAYSKGTIFTEGISFTDLEIKYDVFSQEIVIKPDPETSHLGIIINSSKLDGFKLFNKTFINIRNDSIVKGYYELAVELSFLKLLIKHKKDKIRKLNEKTIHYEFENKYEYAIINDNKYFIVNSKKNWIEIYPKFKKEIKKFYSSNKSLEKKEEIVFMKKLAQYINNLNIQ